MYILINFNLQALSNIILNIKEFIIKIYMQHSGPTEYQKTNTIENFIYTLYEKPFS